MKAPAIATPLLIAILLLIMMACGPEGNRYAATGDTTAVHLTMPDDTMPNNEGEVAYNEYENRYALIAGQTDDYYALQQMMYTIARATGMPLDTMDRVYDEQTHSLRLRDTTEVDAVYMPWRGEGRNLSIEYGDFYDTTIASGKMILLGGLYTTPESADSVLKMVLPYAPDAVVKPCRIFMGCML